MRVSIFLCLILFLAYYSAKSQIISQNSRAGGSLIQVFNEKAKNINEVEFVSFISQLEATIAQDFGSLDPCTNIYVNICANTTTKAVITASIHETPFDKNYYIDKIPVSYHTTKFQGNVTKSKYVTNCFGGYCKIFLNECKDDFNKLTHKLINEAGKRYHRAKEILIKELKIEFYGSEEGLDISDIASVIDYEKMTDPNSPGNKNKPIKYEKNESSVTVYTTTIKDTEKIIKSLEDRKNMIEELLKPLIYSKENYNDKNSDLEEGLASTLDYLDVLYSKKNSLEKSISSLKRKLNGPCPPPFGGPCNCQENHGTDCHSSGYYCETYTQQIPCKDDFRCLTRSKINDKKEGLNSLLSKIRKYKGEKNDINDDINYNNKQIGMLNNDVKIYNNEIYDINEQIRQAHIKKKNHKVENKKFKEREDKVLNQINKFEQYKFDYIKILENLYNLEIEIYNYCKDSQKCSIPEDSINDYVRFYADAINIDYVSKVIMKLNYPKNPAAYFKI